MALVDMVCCVRAPLFFVRISIHTYVKAIHATCCCAHWLHVVSRCKGFISCTIVPHNHCPVVFTPLSMSLAVSHHESTQQVVSRCCSRCPGVTQTRLIDGSIHQTYHSLRRGANEDLPDPSVATRPLQRTPPNEWVARNEQCRCPAQPMRSRQSNRRRP